MKKLLIALITLFTLSIKAQNITGTWLCEGAYRAEFFQEGQSVYGIYNVGNFKHFLSGTISGNQIVAQVVRIDINNNNCRVILNFTYTLNGNTLTGGWTTPGGCDLDRTRGGNEELTRTTAPPRPMNTFGGGGFNPSNDVTGCWSWEDDWFQDNRTQRVYYMANGNGYRQFFSGTRSGNRIQGQLIRYSPNGCRMILDQTFDQTNANTMQYNWVARGSCDNIPNGGRGNGTITRSAPTPTPVTSDMRVYLTTGTGELRGGNNAYMKINYSDGVSSSPEYNLEGGFVQNSMNTVFIRTHRAVASVSEISSIVIRHDGSPRQGHPFDTYGNWTLQAIRVVLVMPDGTEQDIINLTGNPLVQYSGQTRVRTFNR